MLCVYLEASSLDIEFSLAFHHNTSNLQASNANSYMILILNIAHQSKQHKSKCNWSVQSYGFKSVYSVVVGLSVGSVGYVSEAHNTFVQLCDT
jgi:hypothetical protein